MTSLRRTVIARTVLMLALVGCLAAFAAYEAALFEADEFMDDYMRQFAGLAAGAPGPAAEPGRLLEPEDRFERIVWTGGLRTAASAGAPAGVAPPTKTGFERILAGGTEWRTFTVRDGDTTRLLAQRTSARHELAFHAAIEISLVIAATMLVVWMIVTFTVSRVVRRFEEVGAGVAARGVEAHGPLPLGGLPSEILPLANAMNVLIERQGDALRCQRRFIADSAHELRTPLTALRIQIENLRDADGTSARNEADDLRKGILRAGSMLNQLLQMARFDAPRGGEAPEEELDLADVVKQCVADVVEIACESGVDLGLTRCDSASTRISRGEAHALVSNVVDNAVAYTPRGGSVDCTLRCEGATATIEVVDTGPGVAPEHLPRLFDRFFRAAPLDKMGSGLGLAIVKAIADRHGMAVDVANRTDAPGLKFQIRVPLAGGAAELRAGTLG